ncbi:MAG: TRAP transporter permease [Nitrososphaerota archaeon]|nr:TRAP transporter permease [Nitrososphaerota archaeon]
MKFDEKAVITALIMIMGIFQLYVAAMGWITLAQTLGMHLAFVLALGFLLHPTGPHTKKKWLVLDWFLAILGFFGSFYILIAEYTRIGAYQPLPYEIILGIIVTILILELTRRYLGLTLPLLVLAFLAYAFLGQYLPGEFGHGGFSIPRVFSFLYLSLVYYGGIEGIYGTPTEISATIISAFIIFAQFLIVSGLGKFFMDAAFALTGTTSGGPAKVAVISSAFFGTISGSAVANVVATGSFTIPMMKKLGYKPHFAGAVEATASTGGLIMPPIMGAGAFVMAEILQISYFKVALHATIPAILYFLSVGLAVHFEAKKLGLKGLPKEELPKLRNVIRDRGHLIIPVILLIYLMAVLPSVMWAAFWCIIATMVVTAFRKETRMDLRKFKEGLTEAVEGIVPVAIACASAGIVAGIVGITGLGLKFSYIIMSLSGGQLWAALVITMVGCLILGMGLPATPAYIIAAVTMTPALIDLGLEPLVAHMFTFYFSILSAITPPVALAAYAAAGLAGSEPFKVGFTATRLGITAFIVAFLFAYEPSILGLGSVEKIVINCFSASIGILALAIASIGYFLRNLNIIERIVSGISAILLIHPEIMTDLIGYLLLAIVFVTQYTKKFVREKRSH